LLLFPVPSNAQSGDQPEVLEFHQPQVQEAEKQWVGALFLELWIPVLGHAYAGDARRGVVPAVITLGGVGMIVVAVAGLDPATQYGTGLQLVFSGLGVAAIGKIWGMVSAVDTALDYNRRLRERVSPTLALTPDGRASIGVSLRF